MWLSVTNRGKLREPFAPDALRELAPQAKVGRCVDPMRTILKAPEIKL
jgi:hypothetical protein